MTRVVVAASSAVTRAGLEAVLRAEPDLQVVAVVAADADLGDALADGEADVLLLEPGPGSAQPAEWLAPASPTGLAPALVVTSPDRAHHPSGANGTSGADAATARAPVPPLVLVADLPAAAAADWLRAGARAVLPHHATPEQIAAAVHGAAAGLVSLPAPVAGELLEERPGALRRPPPPTGSNALTPREAEVLAMLAEGLGNKSIARRLGLSEHTIKTHVAAVLQKLSASTRTEAVAVGVRRGLVVL